MDLSDLKRLSKLVPPALVIGAALLIWRIFFPALMSFDSFVQYRQAWVGQYDDWHPPLMAIVLHQCFRLGRGIGLVTFVQCLAGLLGVRALAAAWMAAAPGTAVPPRRAGWAAAGVALLLLLPPSPLPFYLATFWKDTWAAVLLVWICALSLRALSSSYPPNPHPLAPSPLRGEGERSSDERPLSPLRGEGSGVRPRRADRSEGTVAALVILAVLLGLARHNAIVVLPFVGLVLAAVLWRRSRAAAVVLALSPLLLCLAAERAIDRTFDVQPRHLERLMMVFDLAGVCAEDARACGELPYARRQAGGAATPYVPGDMARSFPHGILVRDADAAELRAEYLRAVRRFPGRLARVKAEAFAPLVDPAGARMLMYRQLDANEFGLRLNPRFAGVRERLTRATLWAGEESPLLRPLVGSHAVWLALNALGITLLLAWPGRRLLALALLLPLAFALSYLLATPAPDYRFLYPSTLVIQCVALSWGLGWLARERAGRAPLVQ
jgi:hypothetical protein